MAPLLQSEHDALTDIAINLLKEIIAIPSFSREEENVRKHLEQFFYDKGIPYFLKKNNIWLANLHFQTGKKTILLNSHIDTVKPNKQYSMDPFFPLEKEGRLYGLGSNDAGASLVSLLACFLHFYSKPDLPFNIIFAASAEEEISGSNGIELLLKDIGPIDFGIVGEPTLMKMAPAEKGLLVIDAYAKGKSAHVANTNGENAISAAISDILELQKIEFEKISEWLGPVKISVTQINAGQQHNVVPGECHFVLDIRTNEHYSHEEILYILKSKLKAELIPRSFRMKSTGMHKAHPLLKSGFQLDLKAYGSPTTSDKALMPFPALKLGPGDSLRSHTADEFIHLHEIKSGINIYIQLLDKLFENETLEKKQLLASSVG
jgi:acetylornithine deacetylase